MQILSGDTWQRIIFGEPQTHGALAVLPVMADLPTGPDYLIALRPSRVRHDSSVSHCTAAPGWGTVTGRV